MSFFHISAPSFVKKQLFDLFTFSVVIMALLIPPSFTFGNSPPSDIDAPLTLSISENSPIGTVVGKINLADPEGNEIINYKLLDNIPSGVVPKLWLDASKLDFADRDWEDKSGNNNHANIHGSALGYPSIKQNAHNGLSLMHYCGAVGSYHSFEEIPDIRTAFWVLKKKSGYAFILSHNQNVNFHYTSGQFWWDKFASPHVVNGSLFINGASVNGTLTDIPTELSIISLRTTGDVIANNFSNDRNIKERFFNGDLGELIIFNEPLSDLKIKEVESYLHRKWNLPLAYEPIDSAFHLTNKGNLVTNRTFDRENIDHLSIIVRATDQSNKSADHEIIINIKNIVEDLDGDGIEDHFDDDLDGDGVKNSIEKTLGTNPSITDNFATVNHAPSEITSNIPLKIKENKPIGTLLGNLLVTDQDFWNEHNFSFATGQGDSDNAFFSLDYSGALYSAAQFDFENNATQFAIRVAVKDEWNATTEETFNIVLVDEDLFSPLTLDSNIMLWLDASDKATLEQGTYLGDIGPPQDGNETRFWADKSGHEHHALQVNGSPTYQEKGLNGMPSVDTSGDTYEISNSAGTFDAWERMTMVIVYKWSKVTFWAKGIWKHGEGNGNDSVSGWSFDRMNPDNSQAAALWWARKGSSANRLSGNLNMDARKETKLITIRFDGTTNTLKYYANGSFQKMTNPAISRFVSNQTEPVRIGNQYQWGEILIFNDALVDTQRQQVEGYLAHKWNLLHEFDVSHPFKNGGIMDGTISLAEELPEGTAFVNLSDVDPDYNASWSYSLTEANASNDNAEFTFSDQASFDPSATEGLSLWLDASDVSTITADQDGNVSRWADKSSNEYNATAVSGQFPVSGSQTLNGRNVLAWSSNKKMTSNVPNDANWQDCYLVARWSGGSTFPSYNSLFTGKNESSFHGQIHSNRFSWGGWVDEIYLNTKLTKASDSVIEEISQPFIISFSSKGEISANGYVLGADRNINQRSWVGEIAEVLSFDRSLNSLEKQSIEAYLSNKWGLIDQLPAVHPGRKDVLLTATSLDYETNASTYNIHVRATANGSVQNEKKYKILLSNVVEDLDEDGIEDHYDLDDDGDGFPDLIEIAYPSDPRDPGSHANVAPSDINANSSLTISEDAPLNTIVGTFSASDPNGDSNFSFSSNAYSQSFSLEKYAPQIWFDAEDNQTFDFNNTSIKSWSDKSGNGYIMIPHGTPTLLEVNGTNRVYFDGASSLYTEKVWDSSSGEATIMAVARYTGGKDFRVISDRTTNNWLFGFHQGYLDRYFFNGWLLGQSTQQADTKLHLLTTSMRANDKGSTWLDGAPGIGINKSIGSNIFPDQLQFGAWKTNLESSKCEVAEFVSFNRVLTNQDRELIEGYLLQKWQIPKNQTNLQGSVFNIDQNGTLTIAQPLDYETDSNYSVTIRATDAYGASFDKLFTIVVTDVFEDLDRDGIADHLDPDIDGDGQSNVDEISYLSDPYDGNSSNLPPIGLQATSALTVSENLPAGTVVTRFVANDPDGNETLNYLIIEASPLYKASTPYLKRALLAHFPFNEGNGTISTNFGTDGSDATLLNGAVFTTSEKKFGNSALSTPWNSQHAQARIEKPVQLGNDNQSEPFSISVWFKGLYDKTKWRSLTRGKLNNHHVILQNGTYNLGVYNHGNGNFIDSGFKLTPFASVDNWQHLVATLDGKKTRFYIDGSYVSSSLASPGHNIYTIGNHGGGGQLFAKYLDDFRIYGKTLSAHEVITLHGNGNGDYSPFDLDVNGTLVTNSPLNYETDDHNYSLTVRAVDDYGAYVEQDFTIHLTNVLEDVNQDGVEDYDGNQSLSPTDIAVVGNGLKVSENAPVGSVVGQVKGVDPDGDAFHSFTLSTSGDPNRFHSSSVDGLTAWFDASDSRTIQKVESTNKLSAWRNKIDPDIYLSPVLGKEPDTNGSINGLNAVEFTAVDQISKRLWGYKNGANWNPMGVNGAASGKLADGSLYMTFRSNKSTMSGFPFNFGWGDHFPWKNNQIFWRFSDMRRATNFTSNGEELMLCFEFSVSKGIQKLYKNGTVIMSGPRTTETNIGGSFFFPSNYGGDQIPEWTVGEMLVVRGETSRKDHLGIEGYLAHKWGMGDSLPDHHLYSANYSKFSNSDAFLSIDNNGTLRTNSSFDHEIDSDLSITIRATDNDYFSYDKNFTLLITNVQEADLDKDGIEDTLDEDIDGDGVSNRNEIVFGTNPWDYKSVNEPPLFRLQTEKLNIKENQPSGTLVGSIEAFDSENSEILRYSMPPLYPKKIVPMAWLDSTDTETLEMDENGRVWRWKNKADLRHDFVQLEPNNRPGLGNHKQHKVIDFSGNDFLHSEGSFPVRKNFSIFMIAGINEIDSQTDSIVSFDSCNEGASFQFDSLANNGFRGRFSNTGMAQNHAFFDKSQMGTVLYELIFNWDEQLIQCFLNGNNKGKILYSEPPGNHHVFRIFADSELNQFPKGFVGEVMFFDHAIAAENRKQVESYLGNKWELILHDPVLPHLFELKPDGTLYTTSELDYERDSNYTISVTVSDDQNLTTERKFVITVENQIEDADEDGVEDFYDPDDDNDGLLDEADPDDDNDGFSDSDELAYGSNPLDANSLANAKPTSITLDNFSILEGKPIGTLIGTLSKVDPDTGDRHSYSLIDGAGSRNNTSFSINLKNEIRSNQIFDYETDHKNQHVRIRVKDQHNAMLEKIFTIQIKDWDENLPIVQTLVAEKKGEKEYRLGGQILFVGGTSIFETGFILSTTISLTNPIRITSKPDLKNKEFFSLFTELLPNTTYYFRAYAINQAGENRGSLKKFSTALQIDSNTWYFRTKALPGGWRKSNWFGAFQPTEHQWLYHSEMGWLYPSPMENSSLWLWNQADGWRWTQEGVYPYLFRWRDSAWIYLQGRISGRLIYYNYSTQSYE